MSLNKFYKRLTAGLAMSMALFFLVATNTYADQNQNNQHQGQGHQGGGGHGSSAPARAAVVRPSNAPSHHNNQVVHQNVQRSYNNNAVPSHSYNNHAVRPSNVTHYNRNRYSSYGYGSYPVVYFNGYTASAGDVEEDDDGNPIASDDNDNTAPANTMAPASQENWVDANNGEVPAGAIPNDSSASDDPTYYCQATYNNQTYSGILIPNDGCYLQDTANQASIRLTSYTVLVGVGQ